MPRRYALTMPDARSTGQLWSSRIVDGRSFADSVGGAGLVVDAGIAPLPIARSMLTVRMPSPCSCKGVGGRAFGPSRTTTIASAARPCRGARSAERQVGPAFRRCRDDVLVRRWIVVGSHAHVDRHARV